MKAKKSLGQNFLIDNNVINKIIDEVSACEDDLIIEIGPGLGSLTSKLADNAKKVVAIELDQNMIEILKERFSHPCRAISSPIAIMTSSFVAPSRMTERHFEKA